ncbi:MAG: efflux transporter outer membrane subunit [Proteobacteria bacterium]|nr:efflux transporter outer membrane subunit [Pseudomonadota bacterium]
MTHQSVEVQRQRRLSRRAARCARSLLLGFGTSVSMLSGCAVGPDFTPPAARHDAAYTRAPLRSELNPGAGEPAQRIASGAAIPQAWWHLFRSPSLDALIEQVLAASPTIDAARARLAASWDAVQAARGGEYPQLDASAAAQRQKGPPFAAGLLKPRAVPTYNLYSVGATVSFVPDVFGLTRRQIEQQQALAEKQADELAAAQLAVTGNAVAQALTLASLQLQMEAIENIVSDDERNLVLLKQKYDSGKVDRTDVLLAQAQLDTDRTPLPPLKQQKVAAEDALSALAGRSPGAWTVPTFALDEFTLPADLPLVVPSSLVHQRPDILAAEAQMHASSAAIGVAVGRLYPTLLLSAAVDPTALTPGTLFEGPNLDWNVLSGITAPLFHGGTLRAEKRAAIDTFHTSLATYQETVLESLSQVADVLHALEHDAELVNAERQALEATRAALELQRQRYEAGRVDVIRLLDAERSFQQARVGYARSRAQRYLDSAQLLVALGGGWCTAQARCADARLSIGSKEEAPAGASSPHEARP